MHVRHECGARVARGFVDVENFLGRLLGTRGVRTVGGGERQSFQLLTGLDGIGDLIQIHVAGHDLTVSADHADQRALQLLRGIAQRIK